MFAYISGGLAIVSGGLAFACWLLFGQLQDEQVKSAKLEVAVGLQAITIKTQQAQAETSNTLSQTLAGTIATSTALTERLTNDIEQHRATREAEAIANPYDFGHAFNQRMFDGMRRIHETAGSGDSPEPTNRVPPRPADPANAGVQP